MTNFYQKKLILLGSGGHASVLADILLSQGGDIVGIVSPTQVAAKKGVFYGIPLLEKDDEVFQFDPSEVKLVNGIGQLPGSNIRKSVNEFFLDKGYCFESVISEHALISKYARLADGVQILRGAIVQAGVTIGSHSIINTRTTVEHDSFIGEYCHVAPGVTLCGDINVGHDVFIGAGATLIQGVRVAERTTIGAGATIKRNCSTVGAVYK
ncbi:shikimate dehydrogenase [Vibrio tasmaniensis ZS-17]|uniref:acetyltransferase n=1 Tax=Vibrio TaxID=662 RepID=UPI000301EA4A|nr:MULTISPECIES: acetyltransferase [Vibrio]OED69561.1 shikimate dehydrogenase [Vibrio tasmaniensis ZS-17]PMH99356.1 shikimate dehydrogenase [Vibrio lentus]